MHIWLFLTRQQLDRKLLKLTLSQIRYDSFKKAFKPTTIMKKSFIAILIASFFMLGLTVGKKKSEAAIPNKEMVQVGIVVADIEKAAASWAGFLGLDQVPSISIAHGSDLNPTEFKGDLSSATAKLAFFQLDNITIELIEPDGKPSTWQEFLDTKGEGIHHIAFNVDDMDSQMKKFDAHGIPMIQHGGWDTGEYSYMDGTSNLGLIIELLENYNQ